jgi:glutamyl/glutaminyl-tRNA synthetase
MYKAHVGDVSTVLRVALTARTNTPDMYEIMQVLGKNRIAKRLEVAKENLK